MFQDTIKRTPTNTGVDSQLNPLISEPDRETFGSQQINPEDSKRTYVVYTYRWLILAVFIFSGVANAMVLLTWAPITDKAQTYWNNIDITFVNLLSVIFQICYVPGTLLALRFSEKHSLRGLMLRGGALTCVGCVIRLVGALVIDSADRTLSYALVLFGTIFVGLSQPFYLNMPAKIASTWFGVNERDIATTLCSLANPLGSAIGSLIPSMFVNSDDDDKIKEGVLYLVLVQMIVAIIALLLTYFFMQSAPKTPASASSEQMQIMKSARGNSNLSSDFFTLSNNLDYMKLLFAFSIVLGNLNAIATLLNQLPGDYSNGEIGLTGAVLILSGFLGAFVTGFVLDYSKAYITVLKCSYLLTLLSWIFFFANCRENNFPLFILGGALLGGATLPTSKLSSSFFLLHLNLIVAFFILVPSTIVSSVECSYPVPEDASVGLLYMCANLTAIVMTFVGQVFLSMDSPAPAPFFPYGIWVMTFLVLAFIPIIIFRGSNKRLEQDTQV
jgi:hypothetical protein